MLLLAALQILTLGRGVPPVPPVPAPQAGTPHLTHSAPFVGQTLTIHIDGAPAYARVDLFLSPSAGTTTTPYGNLELARGGLHEVANGITSATGSWSVDFPVPLDTSLAETEQHFQAIVDDPSGPIGRVISDALHIRLLGPRVYAGHSGGVDVYSAVNDTVVTRVAFAGGIDSKPVFDATFARGVMMSSSTELLFFDPFFGGVQARIPFASPCSGTLLTDSARHTVYVLESGAAGTARIHAIRLADGIENSYLDLPNPIAGLWCEGSPGTEAFLAEVTLDGQTSIRRVALDPLADLGSAIVGNPGNQGADFGPMIYSAGQVFVSTAEPEAEPPYWHDGCLTRCRVVGSSILTSLTNLSRDLTSDLTAVPDADRVLASQYRVDLGGPAVWMSQFPLSTTGPLELVTPPPGWYTVFPKLVLADGPAAWIAAANEYDNPAHLFRLDLETWTWVDESLPFYLDWAPADELLRDTWDHEIWIATQPYPPWVFGPEILVVVKLHSTSRHIPLTQEMVRSLRAVPLP